MAVKMILTLAHSFLKLVYRNAFQLCLPDTDEEVKKLKTKNAWTLFSDNVSAIQWLFLKELQIAAPSDFS